MTSAWSVGPVPTKQPAICKKPPPPLPVPGDFWPIQLQASVLIHFEPPAQEPFDASTLIVLDRQGASHMYYGQASSGDDRVQLTVNLEQLPALSTVTLMAIREGNPVAEWHDPFLLIDLQSFQSLDLKSWSFAPPAGVGEVHILT